MRSHNRRRCSLVSTAGYIRSLARLQQAIFRSQCSLKTPHPHIKQTHHVSRGHETSPMRRSAKWSAHGTPSSKLCMCPKLGVVVRLHFTNHTRFPQHQLRVTVLTSDAPPAGTRAANPPTPPRFNSCVGSGPACFPCPRRKLARAVPTGLPGLAFVETSGQANRLLCKHGLLHTFHGQLSRRVGNAQYASGLEQIAVAVALKIYPGSFG